MTARFYCWKVYNVKAKTFFLSITQLFSLSQCLCNHCCTVQRHLIREKPERLRFVLSSNVFHQVAATVCSAAATAAQGGAATSHPDRDQPPAFIHRFSFSDQLSVPLWTVGDAAVGTKLRQAVFKSWIDPKVGAFPARWRHHSLTTLARLSGSVIWKNSQIIPLKKVDGVPNTLLVGFPKM